MLDGLVEVGAGTVLFPWTTIGLRAGNIQGPTMGENVSVGTGSKLVGPITSAEGHGSAPTPWWCSDVPAGATAVGVPARVLGPVEQTNPA